jgi:drug/metabolite transporter (DMT)-like permease
MILLASLLTVLPALLLEPVFYGTNILAVAPSINLTHLLLLAGYSGVAVALVLRLMFTASYERVGGAATGGLEYLSCMLAIVLPMVVLRESLSPEILVGAVLILSGLYFIEGHRHMHKHMHWPRAHRKVKP